MDHLRNQINLKNKNLVKNENKNTIQKSMGQRKGSSKNDVYHDTSLPQETKISNSLTLHLKKQKQTKPKLIKGEKS